MLLLFLSTMYYRIDNDSVVMADLYKIQYIRDSRYFKLMDIACKAGSMLYARCMKCDAVS